MNSPKNQTASQSSKDKKEMQLKHLMHTQPMMTMRVGNGTLPIRLMEMVLKWFIFYQTRAQLVGRERREQLEKLDYGVLMTGIMLISRSTDVSMMDAFHLLHQLFLLAVHWISTSGLMPVLGKNWAILCLLKVTLSSFPQELGLLWILTHLH